MVDQLFFFHNYMKSRKHLTQVNLQNVVKREHKQTLNSRYIISHMFTTPAHNQNTSIDHYYSRPTIPECLHQLDIHLAQRRPIQTHFLHQIKNYLHQLEAKGIQHNQNAQNKISLKQSFHRVNSAFKSPHNVSLKKLKAICVQNEKPQLKLRKKKMNFDNIGKNNLIKENHGKQNIVVAKIQLLKEQCKAMKRNAQCLRDYVIDQIGSLKALFHDQVHQMANKFSNKIQSVLTSAEPHSYKAELALTQTISELELRIVMAEKEQSIMREYLKQRQGEILILWQTINGCSL